MLNLTDLEVSILLQVADGHRIPGTRVPDDDWNFATRALFQHELVKHSFTGWQLTDAGRAEVERRRPTPPVPHLVADTADLDVLTVNERREMAFGRDYEKLPHGNVIFEYYRNDVVNAKLYAQVKDQVVALSKRVREMEAELAAAVEENAQLGFARRHEVPE